MGNQYANFPEKEAGWLNRAVSDSTIQVKFAIAFSY
jgi:hypothetical protein